MDAPRPVVFFVLGGTLSSTGPGSGKGTVCKNLVEKNHLVHFSAGDLLREEVRPAHQMGRQSADAALINDYISKGQIVPVKITIGLLKNAMVARGWEVPLR